MFFGAASMAEWPLGTKPARSRLKEEIADCDLIIAEARP